MDFRERNLAAMVEYFAAGCKADKLLGLELEHFVTHRETGLSLPYENGVEEILNRLHPLYGRPILSDGRIIGIMRDSAYITIEPAAQLEISIGPSREIAGIGRVYEEFTQTIAPILKDLNCRLETSGYHPKSKADDLPLIPKPRYEYMYKYFATVGVNGKHMMKGTAATQVSIDIESEADFRVKFRVANIIGPLLSLICDNTKIFEGRPFPGRLARTHIWNNVDPDRSMVVAGALDGDFGFAEYAKYVYDSPAILRVDNGETSYAGATPVSEIFASRLMTQADIEHVISMMFPDVCLKSHLEIRMADSMPIDRALAYTALLKGLFYHEENLYALHEQTIHIKNHDVAEAKKALMSGGKTAQVYAKPALEWMATLFDMARIGLPPDEAEYLTPLEKVCGADKQISPSPSRYHGLLKRETGVFKGLLGCFAVVGFWIMIIFIGIPLIISVIDGRQARARERLLAQEDNVIRYDGNWYNWRGIQGARRVGHEVDIERYRPFRYGNSLVVMQETPMITFDESFPRLDGATAAFPVFAAMAQALYVGLDEYTVDRYVAISQTDAAFMRLINGFIDIFFGAQPSQQQLELARRRGVELIRTPVAREAFVFFVHEDNPVTSLTVSQIQDIYQRNVTNWSYLGGRDERILAFQRPENSGSQTIMLEIMGDLPITEPVMEERMGGMGHIIGYVAVNEYRNVSSAIGYSFRYFVTGMHPSDDINILAINGVAPTIENIRNGTYPFTINVYAITAHSTNPNTQLLLDWILSEQGQRFIEYSGIVPIR
ncbi:MAG: glutamate-cysteine ligase family protein [Defluviitaleaceae bacterium]|nr:glutamate-cysteine ligase family protein [Defluviitaleaceae bacterium]